MQYSETHFTCHHYALPPNTLYMSQLCYSTKQSVHLTIMLYHQTHCEHHRYAIPRNTLYMSQLNYAT